MGWKSKQTKRVGGEVRGWYGLNVGVVASTSKRAKRRQNPIEVRRELQSAVGNEKMVGR